MDSPAERVYVIKEGRVRVMMAMARQIVHLQETLESVVSRPEASRLTSLSLSMQDQADRTPDGPPCRRPPTRISGR